MSLVHGCCLRLCFRVPLPSTLSFPSSAVATEVQLTQLQSQVGEVVEAERTLRQASPEEEEPRRLPPSRLLRLLGGSSVLRQPSMLGF